MPDYPDDFLRNIFEQTRVIALVGASDDPGRPSNGVGRFLHENGFRVIPLNPALAGRTLWGESVRAGLADIPPDDAAVVDMIDIFRRPAAVPAIVTEALEQLPNLRTVWMQIGVGNAEGAALAGARGLAVVQDRCPKIEIPRLFPAGLVRKGT